MPSADPSHPEPVLVLFNLTNGENSLWWWRQGNISLWWWCPGNSDSLLAALPSNLTLAPNTSASVAVVPLKAGHVDIAAWPQEANIRWYDVLLLQWLGYVLARIFKNSWVGLKVQKKLSWGHQPWSKSSKSTPRCGSVSVQETSILFSYFLTSGV